MVDTSAPEPETLPFWTSVAEAYWLTWSNLRHLGGLVWLWLAVLLPVVALAYWAVWPFELASRADPSVGTIAAVFSPSVFEMLAGASIAVAWHRRLLLGEGTPGAAYFRLDRTVARYFGWAALLFLLIFGPFLLLMTLLDLLPALDGSAGTDAVAPDSAADGSDGESAAFSGGGIAVIVACLAGLGALVFGLLKLGGTRLSGRPSADRPGHDEAAEPRAPHVVLWVSLVLSLGAAVFFFPSFMLGVGVLFPVMAALCYVPTRLSLMLPALALGHDQVSAGDVWQRTRGLFWRLFLGLAVTTIPLVCLSALLFGIFGEAETRLHYARDNAVLSMLSIVLGIVGVSYLSVAYRQLFGLPRV